MKIINYIQGGIALSFKNRTEKIIVIKLLNIYTIIFDTLYY